MQVQKQKVDHIDPTVNNRTARRAYAAMAKKNKPMLDNVCMLAAKMFDGDMQKTKDWLYTPIDGDQSPVEMVLAGNGTDVLKKMKDMISKCVL